MKDQFSDIFEIFLWSDYDSVMRIISLNIWGGRVYKPLMSFVMHYSSEVDVFCFQEVFNSDEEFIEPSTGAQHHILQHLKRALPDFTCHYFPAQDGPGMDANIYPGISYGLAIFVHRSSSIKNFGDIFVYGERNSYTPDGSFSSLPRNMAYVEFELHSQPITIYNYHGLWTGRGKGDTKSRIKQSHAVRDFIASRPGLTVLCGDFNLLPETKSLAILEDKLVNLVSTHGITSTRTSLYDKEPKFADYILVSPEIVVNEFKVLPNEVSDHSPLFLDFTVNRLATNYGDADLTKTNS